MVPIANATMPSREEDTTIFFQDKDGTWWATMFFNPRGAQAAEYKVTCRPGLIPMIYENGKFKPNFNYNTK